LANRDSFGAAFGRLVRQRRGDRGLSQANLAAIVFADRADPADESHKADVSRLETGRIANPQARIVVSYAQALGITDAEVAALRRAPDIPVGAASPEVMTLVAELHHTKATSVPLAALTAMARKINPRITDRNEVVRALDSAVDLAVVIQARGESGSNVDAFVDATFRRLADLTAEGALDAATAAADTAVSQAEAGFSQLLEAAVRQHLLAFDAEGAARQILRKLTIDSPNPSRHFVDLGREQDVWYERGRDRGLRLDLQVAAALARAGKSFAQDAGQRGQALDGLGNILTALGERTSSITHLFDAISAYSEALKVRTKDSDPIGWAETTNNLGNTLNIVGEWREERSVLFDAISAFRAALTVRTHERDAHAWAMTTSNLGTSLAVLGRLASDAGLLRESIDHLEGALDVLTLRSAKEQWATTQSILGAALGILGEQERDMALLDRSARALRSALLGTPREHRSMDWSIIWNNLGDTLRVQGRLEGSADMLREAISAMDFALEVRTREGTPNDWGVSTANQGVARLDLARLTKDRELALIGKRQIAEAEAATREAGNTFFADYCASQLPVAEALVARLGGG
jgi:tetratricopeptide (TPR) repeat protein/transcriptional regulator with XRE-family HTH domain